MKTEREKLQPTFWVEAGLHQASIETAAKIKSQLLKQKWKLNQVNHEYFIIVGGDGTYVRHLRKYYNRSTKIVCINSGTVGFYSCFNHKHLQNFEKIITDPGNYIHPHLLQIQINDNLKYNAMNEMVVQSLNTVRMDVGVNGTHYEHYMGSGVLIATRSGATGQAKSNGGAIILPTVDAFEFVELAPTNHCKHHSFNAPLILDGAASIELNNIQSAQRCDLIIDGMRVMSIKTNQKLVITKVNAPFQLCFCDNIKAYIDKLQVTFIKG